MQASIIYTALSHTNITEEQAQILAKLPSPFCVCKRCYSNCESIPQEERSCPPLYKQSYIVERVVTMLQHKRAKQHLISSDPKSALVFAIAYIELYNELLTSLLIMHAPLIADTSRVKPSLAEAEKIVREHWCKRMQAIVNNSRRRRMHSRETLNSNYRRR